MVVVVVVKVLRVADVTVLRAPVTAAYREVGQRRFRLRPALQPDPMPATCRASSVRPR